MDLKHLKAFLHTAELGSLSRAAERLHLTQPALSRQIRLLEEELGTRLFERTGRGVVLSDTGALFERRVRPLVGQLEDAAGDVAALSEAVTGHVVLGIPPSIDVTVMAELLARYRAAYPEVTLRVAVLLSGAVRDGLARGTLDIGFLHRPLPGASLVAEDLWTEDLYLVGPASADLAGDRPVPFAEAVARPLVLPGARHGLRLLLETVASGRGLELSVPVEVESLRLQMELVRRGMGFTLLPWRTFARELEAGQFRAAPVTDPTVSRTAVLARARDIRQGRAAAALAEMIRGEAAGWSGTPSVPD